MPGPTWEIRQEAPLVSDTGLSPSMATLSRNVLLRGSFVTPSPVRVPADGSHDPECTTHTSLHAPGLGCFPFARRYSGSRGFFSFLQVLRCFNSLRSLPHPMNSGADPMALPTGRFRIQKSPDQRLLSSSPELIAATPRLSSAVGAKTSTMNP